MAAAQQAAGAGAAGEGASPGGAQADAGGAGKDDVVDAEFEEVRDKDRKA
jgi:molecular chaperone DnaK